MLRLRVMATVTLLLLAGAARTQEVVVLGGVEGIREWLQSENWWGETLHARDSAVPRVILTGISPNWRTTAETLPVPEKKEIFYRLMLPLVVHANDMVRERRDRLVRGQARIARGQSVAAADFAEIRDGLRLLRVTDAETAAAIEPDDPALPAMLDELLYRLDVVPAGLALGQAAYESGYGTSRFAAEGNALFGQWTYGGEGLVPEQQRKNLGDHRIAAYDWPFDSVRDYFINLMSHPAYEDFRRRRADLRARGEPLDSLVLADGLVRYSERGEEYVDTLKSMIRVNGLDAADGARFRDEPMRLIVGAESEARAQEIREAVDEMAEQGELERIVARMRLD